MNVTNLMNSEVWAFINSVLIHDVRAAFSGCLLKCMVTDLFNGGSLR